jgi:hypothetical protein
MRALRDKSEFHWIEKGRIEPVGKYDDPDWPGNSVSLVIPPMFDRYIKVLHRLEAHYENIDNPLSPSELEILRIPGCGSLRRLVEQHRNPKTTRVLWKTVAEAFGIAFGPAISDDWFRAVLEPGCWPRFIYGPGDAWLDSEDCGEMAKVLPTGSSQELYVRMAEIPLIGTETPLLYELSFAGLNQLIESERNPLFPEYWWPQDRSWCVCSDYDLSFTLIGCDGEVADKLMRSQILECLEVRPETRVDHKAPIEFAPS